MGIAKPTKMSSKKLILDVINQLEEETGFHFIDITFGDTYFIASGPKDSICHFHIKEIPGFLFAFWNTNRFDDLKEAFENNNTLWSDYYGICSKSELVFFTQYERDIDKFKPSYSGFLQGIYRNAWYELNDKRRRVKQEEWYFDDVPNILEFMHKHPIKAYIYSGCGHDKVYYEVSGLKALHIYLKDAFHYHKNRIKDRIHKKHLIHISKRFVKSLNTMDYMIEVEETYKPKINIRLARKNNVNIDDFIEDVNIIDEFENKYFGNIDVSCWFEYIVEDKDLTPEKIENDASLNKRFHEYANIISEILNGNSKETLDEYLIEEVIDMNISKEED